MAKQTDPNQFTLPNVRLSYAKLFKAEGFNGSEENKKFSCNFLLDKKDHKKLIDAIEGRIAEMQKEKKAKLRADKLCLKDGDEIDSDGYEGCMAISASNAKRPQTVRFQDGKNVPVTEEDALEDDLLYSGCYVDGVIRLWFQDNQYGKRINASLEIVRHRRAGERFGAPRADADEILDDLPEDEYDDDDLGL